MLAGMGAHVLVTTGTGSFTAENPSTIRTFPRHPATKSGSQSRRMQSFDPDRRLATSLALTPRALLLRLGSIALFVVLILLLPQVTEDDSLKQVLPPFMAQLYLQLMPLFWSRKPDLFEPPTYFGLYSALATISTVSFFL